MRGRRFWGAVALAVALATAAGAQEKIQPRVMLGSTPEGATITVDGENRGTTPTTLFNLKPGRHHVKLTLAGYDTRDLFIDTAKGPFIERNETLEEIKGLLLVRSEPAGASIVVDGVTVGQTPRLITHLAAKDPHTVKLRKAGYQDEALAVRFEGRRPVVCEAKLVLSSGVIEVLSEPAGAKVTVNGIDRGKTPLTVSGVPRGRATVRLALDGFSPETRELSVNAGDRQTLSVAMKGLPGTLHLVSIPEGARFYVNDEARGAGPLTISGLAPGDYEVRAEREGYGTVMRTLTLKNGQSMREEFRLSNVMGRLEIRTDPVGAQVILDGHVIGTTKAKGVNEAFSDIFAIDTLLEGEHVLTVRKDGYKDATRHPKIQNSKTSVANVRLKRIFVPDVEIVTVRGEYRGVLKSQTSTAVEVEVSLGITRTFSREEIRKITMLDGEKNGGKNGGKK